MRRRTDAIICGVFLSLIMLFSCNTIVAKPLAEIDKEKKENDSKIQGVDTKIQEKKKQLDEAKTKLDDADEKLKDAKTKLDDADEKLKDAKTKLDDADKKLEDAKKKVTDLPKKISEAESQLTNLQKDVDRMAEKLAQLSDKDKAGSEGKKIKDASTETGKKMVALQTAIEEAKKQLKTAPSDQKAAEENQKAAKKEWETRETNQKTAKKEWETRETDQKAAKKERETHDNGMKKLTDEQKELNEKKQTLETAFQEELARILPHMECFALSRSLKHFNEQSKAIEGSQPSVFADLIRVKVSEDIQKRFDKLIMPNGMDHKQVQDEHEAILHKALPQRGAEYFARISEDMQTASPQHRGKPGAEAWLAEMLPVISKSLTPEFNSTLESVQSGQPCALLRTSLIRAERLFWSGRGGWGDLAENQMVMGQKYSGAPGVVMR